VPNQDSFPAAGENPDVSKHRRVDGEDRRMSTVVVEKLRTFEVTHIYMRTCVQVFTSTCVLIRRSMIALPARRCHDAYFLTCETRQVDVQKPRWNRSPGDQSAVKHHLCMEKADLCESILHI
jgi:hypothetical protein